MKGFLEKRSSDGTWKRQRFAIHKHKLYYDGDRRASLDLLLVKKVERVGPRLLLWLDDTRKHQLRAADDGPSLDEWERSIHRVRRRHDKSNSIPEEDEIDHDFYRSQIIEFYQRHNPAKLDDVDTLIAKYKDIGINEAELLVAIRNKYKS